MAGFAARAPARVAAPAARSLPHVPVRPVSTPSAVQRPLAQVRRTEFARDLTQNGHLYAATPGQAAVAGRELDKNLGIYDASANATLPVIIGPSKGVHNFGEASSVPFTRVLETINPYVNPATLNERGEQVAAAALKEYVRDNPSHLKKGSILFEAFWSLAVNDSLIQGAIDGGKEIHVALSTGSLLSIDKNLLYDPVKKRPTVLGRELLAIASQGYSRVDHSVPQLGIVLVPPKQTEVRPKAADLKDKLEKVDVIKGADDILEALSGLFNQK